MRFIVSGVSIQNNSGMSTTSKTLENEEKLDGLSMRTVAEQLMESFSGT